jgi:predicted O-methyltransferase YrrM
MYSSTPSFREIETSFEYAEGEPPYLDSSIFDAPRLQSTLERLREFSVEFDPPIEGDEARCDRFFWKNSQFSFSDAMAYYCFVRAFAPRTIVEVGSGFSTLVAAEAMDRNGAGRLVCIEPFPRPFLARIPRVELIQETVQACSSDRLNAWLAECDFVFIDGTHTVKTGSDCVHLYLRLLPRIGRNVRVHAHDVFLPFGLPKRWLKELQYFWTEQHLLLAFLIDNPRLASFSGAPTTTPSVRSSWTSSCMDGTAGAAAASGSSTTAGTVANGAP